MKIMKIAKSAMLLLLLSIAGVTMAQCPNVVWGDEFSGSSLDVTKWNYQIGDGCAEGICGWGNNELQSYQEANVGVSNGTLKITAKKERIRGSQYTSGRINSKGKGDFTYGRFEASVKLPYGDGLWPAFWMLSTNEPYGGWPQSGEIDIMEFTASNPTNVYGTIHYGDPYPNNQYQGNDFDIFEGAFPDAFHEFAIEWEPNEIRWYIDGILYSTKTSADVSPYNWPFDHDFHFLLNVAVGGNLGGPVNNGMLPATMEVDYVRVYDGFRPSIGGNLVVANQASGEAYSITNVSNGTSVSWTVPAGATIVSGQGTKDVIVDFGTASGYVSATFNAGCGNQTLSMGVEVEPPYVRSFAFENFDEAANVTFSQATGTLTEVANPGADAVNPSAISGKYVRNSGEQYDVLVYNTSAISNADSYANKDKKFYMDVYTSAPIGTKIILQLETPNATPTNYPTGRHSRYEATVAQNNSWQRMIFSLLDRPDPSAAGTDVGTMILLFSSNTFTGHTYYFDNLDNYDADTGGGSNQSPTVSITSPVNGSSYTQGTQVTISADANDADGTIASVEFFANGSSLGVDNSAPYSLGWTVASGTTDLTARATDNDGASATSAVVSVTGNAGGSPTSVHVEAITIGSASAGKGNKHGTATITVHDNVDGLVANANVTATFSGTFNETVSGTTNASGQVTLQTAGSAKGGLSINVCVDDVSASLPYAPGDNTVTCTSGSARLAPEGQSTGLELRIYPNPATDVLFVNMPAVEGLVSVSITDMTGRQLIHQASFQQSLDISQLSTGIYLLELKAKDFLVRHKFVK
ncbi:family 16 glycosylhydrolase [Marinoscillum sp.]|uniref:family 16 glycosylhydrolase n=1 Tax=Marinoscillum sp. TaxID=2024838 RepID=UPI003BAC5521